MEQYRKRLLFVAVLLAAALFVVVGKLFTIQVVEGKKYVGKIQSQAQQRRSLPAKRGAIYDRRGRQLAASVEGRGALDLDMLGVADGGQAVLRRIYPMMDVAGPVVGYIGKDGYGLGGVEYTLDHYLRGEDGWEMAHRTPSKDGSQKTYSKPGMSRKAPRDGHDVYLTLDINLQKIVQSALKQAVEAQGAKGAMAIVMDPRTGKILAMANEPSFNPNVPLSFDAADRKNKCVSVVYEPGSTFKAITAAIALQEGMVSEVDLIDGNNGIFEIYGQTIRDEAPQGRITFSRAFAVSSNVCFAQVASGFKSETFYRYCRDFGFGARAGAVMQAFQGEEAGTLHPVNEWSGRTKVTMAMGYEVAATFLQMVTAYAAVAHNGVLMQPVICDRIESRDGTVVHSAETKAVRRVMSPDNAARLRRMMKEVVESGTGTRAAVSGLAVGGKTGTTRKPDAGGGYSRTRHWASFIGFLPVETPELLCGVVIDEPPSSRAGGGQAAAPVFAKIMNQALAHPELEYLKRAAGAVRDSAENRPIKVPAVSGRTRIIAAAMLDSMKIGYSFVGEGDIIRYQAPVAGSFMANRPGGIVLYTDEREVTADSTSKVMPNAVGKDLRDAFNLFNTSGLSVYAVGSGMVRRQSIAPGEIMTSAAVCTLYGNIRKR